MRNLPVIAVLLLAVSLAGCASRPETGFLTPVALPDAAATGETEHTLLVATTRERDKRPGAMFNGERAQPLDFAQITVSVPPTHVDGAIEWASTPPGNPQTDFVVRRAGYLDGDRQFLDALNAQLAKRPPGQRKVLLFVHGYNTMFAESLYRLAQVSHDSKGAAVPVLFSWASRGSVGEYVYDNNSATIARDDLERTIRLLFASKAEQVNILAHSMGNWVTVETFRQIRLSGRRLPPEKIGTILLAAPDIDMDVFKSQLRTFGKPPKPYYIILSRDDQALRVSTFIAGGRNRVGATSDVDELTKLGAVVIDLTDVKGTDSSNHSKFAQLADIAPELEAVLARGVAANKAGPGRTREVVGGTLGDIVGLPIKIIGAPLKILSAQ